MTAPLDATRPLSRLRGREGERACALPACGPSSLSFRPFPLPSPPPQAGEGIRARADAALVTACQEVRP